MNNNKNMAGISVGFGIVCLAIGLYGMYGRGEPFMENLPIILMGFALFLQAYFLNKN